MRVVLYTHDEEVEMKRTGQQMEAMVRTRAAGVLLTRTTRLSTRRCPLFVICSIVELDEHDHEDASGIQGVRATTGQWASSPDVPKDLTCRAKLLRAQLDRGVFRFLTAEQYCW